MTIINNTQNIVIQKYPDAPILDYISPDMLKFNSNNDIDNSKHILSHYRNNTLIKFIGDCVANTYKKESPCDQSIWTVDNSRRNMTLKRPIHFKNNDPNDSIWIPDKEGIEAIKFIIKPLMPRIKNYIDIYIKEYPKLIEKAKGVEHDMHMENLTNCGKLIKEIDSNKLQTNILKYVAPRFAISI